MNNNKFSQVNYTRVLTCPDCSHLTSKHDNFGCIIGSCGCVKTSGELMGEYSFPALPSDIFLSKRGYVKHYKVDPDELFSKAVLVAQSFGTFGEYEVIGKRYLKGFSRCFSIPESNLIPRHEDAFLREDFFSIPFEMEIEVNATGNSESELVLRYYYPRGLGLVNSSAYNDPPDFKASRVIFDEQTRKFISRLDRYT